ncbi:MAG TPA: thiamine pyrophosphate-dependent enzyme [Planctomycetota bacterium]|nr:thiamine pyrophosphate-dependent enzyme [Planctomycetota bacterium]
MISRTAAGSAPAPLVEAKDVRDEDLLRFYRDMVRTRVFDRQMVVLQRQGKIGFTIPCEGEEAAHIGAAACVDPETDWLFPSYRQQGMAIALGVPMVEMTHQMFNTAKDRGSKGRQMPVHFSFVEPVHWVSISSPLGTQIPQAVGAARAMQTRGEKGVVFTMFGDGSTSTNGFHSGMGFAGVWKAPVVFLCDNNGWAISCPTSAQTASDSFAVKGKAYGIPGAIVDGNDVVAVRRAVGEAADRARSGGGPTLLELVTYRIGGHSSSDDPKRYRDEAELTEWRRRDPIERLERLLVERRALDTATKERIWAEAKSEVDHAVEVAASTPPPPIESMFEDVYADLSPRLARQRDELLDVRRRHGGETAAAGEFPL